MLGVCLWIVVVDLIAFGLFCFGGLLTLDLEELFVCLYCNDFFCCLLVCHENLGFVCVCCWFEVVLGLFWLGFGGFVLFGCYICVIWIVIFVVCFYCLDFALSLLFRMCCFASYVYCFDVVMSFVFCFVLILCFLSSCCIVATLLFLIRDIFYFDLLDLLGHWCLVLVDGCFLLVLVLVVLSLRY